MHRFDLFLLYCCNIITTSAQNMEKYILDKIVEKIPRQITPNMITLSNLILINKNEKLSRLIKCFEAEVNR